VGDTGKDQHTIRTVHKQGFQFVAEVSGGNASPEARKPVLVVMPFRALSAAPDDAYVAEGLCEEIIASLTRFRDVTVLSALTAAHFQAQGLTGPDMAQAHDVDMLIEGSLRRSQERLRVTVQVSDARSGEVIQTEQFDRDSAVAAIFDIQDEIGQLIGAHIGNRYGEAGRVLRRRTAPDNATWDAYAAMGRFYEFYKTYDLALHAELRDKLPEVLRKDPASGDAWAAYALILLEERRYHLNERAGIDVLCLALEAAQKGSACDPQSGFAQMVLALCQFHTADLPGFKVTSKRALELNPGHADILAEIGHCYAFLGDFDRAVPLLDKAIALSPVHPGWYHYAHAWRFALGDFWQAALLEIEKVPMPGFLWYHAHQAWFLAELGETRRAEAAKDALLGIFPEFETAIQKELVFHYFTGPLVERAFRGWRKAGLNVAPPPD
jgi:TolB-like protein